MNNKEKNFVSAVIYVHNSAIWIEKFLTTIIDILETIFEKSEIICVNDCSSDASIAAIKNASRIAKSTIISILNMSYFHGRELAMNAGVDLSIGDFVYEFDYAILDFDKDQVIRVYQKLLDGFDIVSASPNRRQRVTSRIYYQIFQKFTKLSDEIQTETFRILSRRVINRISNMNEFVPYRKALYANCGLKTANVYYDPIIEQEKYIMDKDENKYRLGLAVDTLILFTNVGYSFSFMMTVIMMLLVMFMAIYSLIIYLTSSPVAGWTTTILFISFAFFGLFGILTVIIKYLQILVDLSFRRKHYSFESIEKITR